MARMLGLALVFLVCLYLGFWVSAAPLAVAIKLLWWNEPIGAMTEIAIGCFGLASGVVLAILATRLVARKWSET